MQIHEAKAWFHEQLREALTALYDPSVLRKSPLVQVLELDERRNVILSLRETLSRAIEALQPTAHTPREAKIWRTYHILRRRYIEQVAQREVALDLGLSTRQLQRDEAAAREALVDYLWDAFELEAKYQQWVIEATENQASIHAGADIPSREQELDYLQRTTAEHITDIDRMLGDVLKTLRPLFEATGATISYTHTPAVHVYAKPPLLRQALINLLSTILQCAPKHETQIAINLHADDMANHILMTIQAQVQQRTGLLVDVLDNLEMTRNLLHLCGGQIEIHIEPQRNLFLSAQVRLPMETPITVLVIDDNADTCQLFERYLHNTRYHFMSLVAGQTPLATAVQKRPSVIVLDVMMPEQDGWELLGQLRQHPATERTPIIVCTILAQETLAYALGAAGFIQKPVNQQQFVEALNRLLVLRA